MNPYIETLYRTKVPAPTTSHQEFFELSVGQQTVEGQLSYYVREIQCWWDTRAKRTVRVQYTRSPRKGFPTAQDAYQRFQMHRMDLARRGYVHCFIPVYEAGKNNKYARIEIPAATTNAEIQQTSEVSSEP